MANTRVWATVVGLGLITAACSGEDIAERIVENRLEAESGQDVDIDLDDGGVSVQTEDGEFSIRTDADGNVSVEGAGGSGDERFTIDSENGETVVETEDGTATLSQNGDVPDDFPSDVAVPAGTQILFSQALDTPDGRAFSLGGTSPLTPADFAGEFESTLVGAGYDEEQRSSPEGDNELLVYRNADRRVQAVVTPGDDGSGFQITVQPVTD